jgi:sugar fermentation stimulation protein A
MTSRLAEFPDCASARAARHLGELQAMADGGGRSVALFVAQRCDCDRFAVAGDLDPKFAAALAACGGIEVLAYGCAVSPERLRIDRPLALA